MDRVNLRERFGRRYRITFDPVYDAKGRHRDKLDPWMMQIPCRRGTIFPYGEDTLAVELNRHPGVAKQLVRLGLLIVQDGDHEKTFVFSVDRFDAIAEIVMPRQRRQISEAERQRLTAMSERHGF